MSKKEEDDQQLEFFVSYIVDTPLRDGRDTMERPFFSLSKNKRVTPIEYISPCGRIWVKVFPNPAFGMATIWDADILIWAISQITYIANSGEIPPRTIRFRAPDLLKAIGRNPRGKTQHDRLRYALDRLKSTTVKTNIRAGGYKKTAIFDWLDSWREITNEKTGKTMLMELTLPDWLYKGILHHSGVLAVAN